MRPPSKPPVSEPDDTQLRVLIADDDEDDYILTRDLLLRIGRQRVQTGLDADVSRRAPGHRAKSARRLSVRLPSGRMPMDWN